MKSVSSLAGILALCAGTGLFAAVKPLAIWNGEFASVTPITRNDVKLGVVGDPKTQQYYEIASSSTGSKLTPVNGAKMGQAIIANISNIPESSEYDRVLFDCVAKPSNIDVEPYWLLLNTEGKIDIRKSSMSGVTHAASNNAVDFSRQHSFGMMISLISGKSYGFLDGVPVHSNNLVSAANLSYLIIGTRKDASPSSQKYFLTGAHVSYIAVFPQDQNLSQEDFATWSLHEMTSAETVTAGAAIVGGSSVGVNLLGGEFRVNGATSAHALFVQGNSSLVFEGSSPSLTLAGPVYISKSCTLTLSLADGVKSCRLNSPHFADADQILAAEGLTISKTETEITVAREGATDAVISNFTETQTIRGVAPEDVQVKASDADGNQLELDITHAFTISDDTAGGVTVEFTPEKPQISEVTVDDEKVQPIQVSGDKVVLGVKTTPGLWYATVASDSVADVVDGNTPTDTPVMATGEAAKMELPAFDSPVMFYKVIVAPSKAAMEAQRQDD